jgi:hypothetical protein
MIEALLAVLGPRWRATPEVVVSKPVRGVIDLVLHDPDANIVVAVDAQSELRRLEQQLRWSQEKAAALPSSELWRFADLDTAAPTVSRLLLLRSTRTTRDLTLLAEGALRSAYPARPADAVAALRGDARWPGDAILWVRTHGTQTTVLDRPPRGVSLGR